MRASKILELIQRVNALPEADTMQPDEIDFSWWCTEDLLNFAFDYDKVKELNEDNTDALIYALARRLDDTVQQDS